MWLIDAGTFHLKYFHDPPPQYAILSHTWGEDEVVFKDMDDLSRARQKNAWLKIQLTCDEARKNKLPYAWIDSCCIDKSSSAELSEAINSMLEWYRQSTCCYAYLEDFNLVLSQNADTISRAAFNQLKECRWFTRGWTLQELIAPAEVTFFSRAWEVIGTKESLKHDLAEITGIDMAVLESVAYMPAVPVGRRMSWAAKRHTTRVEDMAYCLMGIFNVNMPLLYGEREKAFIRLQEEIARQHRDLSLFAWRQQDKVPRYRGIFADSPAEFSHCNSLVSQNPSSFFSEPNYSVTDTGLLIEVPGGHLFAHEPFALSLDCTFQSHSWQSKPKNISISLQKFGAAYVRALPNLVSPKKGKLVNPGRGIPTKDTGTISVKKSLPPSHSSFIDLMLQRKLVLLYRREMVEELKTLNGMRQFAQKSPNDFLQGLCRLNGVDFDDYSVVHEYDISLGGDPIWWDSFTFPRNHEAGDIDFVVVCGIPLKPNSPAEHILPWFALLSSENFSAHTRGVVAAAVRTNRQDSPPAIQRLVGDAIFEKYADRAGNVLQGKLPTIMSFDRGDGEIVEVRVNRLGAGGSTFCADIQFRRLLSPLDG